MNLSKSLFWDVNVEDIDFDKHIRFVIERVASKGSLEDIRAMLSYYGKEKLRQEAIFIKAIDKKSLNFLSVILEVPIKTFKCYSTIQSSQTHWNY